MKQTKKSLTLRNGKHFQYIFFRNRPQIGFSIILAELYNPCIQTEIYPTILILKIGQILPIFKSGAKEVTVTTKPSNKNL